MRKSAQIVFIVLCALLLFSCDDDPYKGQRPCDYPDTRWVCEEYGAAFTVTADQKIDNGTIILHGKTLPFKLTFLTLGSNGVSFYTYDESGKPNVMFSGAGDFGKEVFKVRVKDTEGYYDEKSVVLVFKRESKETT